MIKKYYDVNHKGGLRRSSLMFLYFDFNRKISGLIFIDSHTQF